jgi:uncharacterized membrane protein (GlpM family)
MNPILNYSIQFVVGGGIIVVMSILAKNFHPKYAALIYALPIQFTIAAIFIYLGTKQGTIQQLAQNSLFYILGFVIFIISFYFLTKNYNFWTSLGISYLIFFCITLIILKFT